MITPEKIEEWLKEVEERPASAALIIQYITNRLRDLTSRAEALQAENIALLTGKRVEEYERRIAHLEYQLELLKRQLGGDREAAEVQLASGDVPAPRKQEAVNLLVYDHQGQVLRLAIPANRLEAGSRPGMLALEADYEGELPRLVVLPDTEELLFIFSSGRIATLAVTSIPAVEPDSLAEGKLSWRQAALPHPPRPGESLACLAPVSKIALAESFVQASRRGFVKRVNAAMAQSILANRFIGSGVTQPADQTFELILCNKDDRLALVSQEGYLQCVEAKRLPFSVEEAMRLDKSDHLVSALTLLPGRSLLAVTQIGKLIHRTTDSLETAASFRTKGQALFSAQRRAQGVRVVGAAAVGEEDWAVALQKDGQLSLHAVSELFATGTIPVQGELVGFAAFSIQPLKA